jgi:dUTP pyrophosphatase
MLLDKSAVLPAYAHDGDAGFDLFTLEKITLKSGEFKTIHLGLTADIPKDYFVSFRDKSGLASKFGLHVLAGVLDSGYHGEWMTVVVNLGKEPYVFAKGDKIIQGILQYAPQAEITTTKKLAQTERGTGGFGSTGKK